MSESILDENLIGTFEASLRQTRNAQNRLMVRLREVEAEADRLRQEIEALDNSAEKTEAAIYSILATMGSKNKRNIEERLKYQSNRDDDTQYNDFHRPENQYRDNVEQYNNPRFNNPNEPTLTYDDYSVPYPSSNQNNQNDYSNRNIPQVSQNIEPISQRFVDRTITQACTLLLRESGKPLHVNELYNFLVAGGFKFTGKNPTISIAVSLNRNRRFHKIAPGTFDLVIRDASKAVS